MYSVTRLPNGLTITTAAMPHMASVSAGVWVGIGSRYEPARLNGVCHFIEHMLFKGTRRRTAKDISQAVEGIGGYLNAFTSEETTCFHARARADRFDDLLDVLADMLLNSVFDPAETDKEREVIKEEVAMYLDQPQTHVQELLNATLWPGQPLGRPITGREKTLNGLGHTELRRFLRANYVANNTLIAVAGNVNHRRVVKAMSRYAKQFPGAKAPTFPLAEVTQTEPRITLFPRKTEQTQIALGIYACSRHDERRYALRLLNTLLGENMSSRLFQVVREDRGLAYSIYSGVSFWDDVGDLVVSAGLDTDNLSKALKLILREMRHFTESPPGPAELRRARDYAIGQLDLALESTDNQMNWVGEQLLGYGRIYTPADVKRRLAAVRPAEIRAVARDLFRPERLNLALVSPLKTTKSFEPLLARL